MIEKTEVENGEDRKLLKLEYLKVENVSFYLRLFSAFSPFLASVILPSVVFYL
jgi:hypothetical protein